MLCNDEGPDNASVLTCVDEIRVNDGKMKMVIKRSELKKVPGMHKDFTVYHIEGSDSLGEIQITRRYKEFKLLRELLFARYPGLYIPPIPATKIQGNMGETFVEERKYFLNLFLYHLCHQTYLVSSPEMQVFVRPRGDCLQSMKSLEKQSTNRILRYYMV
jgi:hypothetical protein